MNRERLEMEGRLAGNELKLAKLKIKAKSLIGNIRSEINIIVPVIHIDMSLVKSLVEDLSEVHAKMVDFTGENKEIREELGIEEEG